MDILTQPWPWYIAGPIIGLMVPIMLLISGRQFGFSENLRHICASCNVANVDFFNYDWKAKGAWNLMFSVGVILGGFIGGVLFANPNAVKLSAGAIEKLQGYGLTNFDGFVPVELFTWGALQSNPGLWAVLGVGGFLVGFGTRYAGGCTSGHAISGLSNLQLASLIAVIGFFIGGLLMTYLILPNII